MYDDLAADVRAAAAATGVPVEDYVHQAIARRLMSEHDFGGDANPRIDRGILDEAIASGDTVPWDKLRPWVESWGKPDELPPP